MHIISFSHSMNYLVLVLQDEEFKDLQLQLEKMFIKSSAKANSVAQTSPYPDKSSINSKIPTYKMPPRTPQVVFYLIVPSPVCTYCYCNTRLSDEPNSVPCLSKGEGEYSNYTPKTKFGGVYRSHPVVGRLVGRSVGPAVRCVFLFQYNFIQ